MLKKWIKEYIQINKREILVVVGLLLLGIIIGVGVYVFSPNEVKNIIVTNVKSVLEISKTDTYVKTNVIMNGVRNNLVLISLLAILSVTLFGKWIIYFLTIIKGAAISLYTILLFNIFGPLWGIIVTLILVILVNVLYIPAFICLIITFLEIHFSIFKTKLNLNISTTYRVLLVIFICFVIMFSSIIVEQIGSSVVLNIYNKI